MNARLWIGIATLAVAASTLVAGAPAAPKRASGALELRATLGATWTFSDTYCPPGTPQSVECVRFRGTANVPGLGRVITLYTKTIGDPACEQVTQFRSAVIEVEGKGQINLALPGPLCGPYAPAELGPLEVKVTGGSGRYAGAFGTLQFKSSVYSGSPACGCGTARDTWTGVVTVPNIDFDLTPPAIKGAVSKHVRLRRGAKRARVGDGVKAVDAVDGPVPVSCVPRAGSYLKLGRTKVRCSATDRSGNTRRAQFTVTVRRL